MSKPLIIAHRGASGHRTENTKSAFLKALDIGVDAIELDVQLTKDKVIVVSHDCSLGRVAGVNKTISSMTFNEIKKIELVGEEKIITLDEALALLSGKSTVIVEPKESLEGHERELMVIIQKYNKKDNIWIHAMSYRIIKNVRRLDPKIKLGIIVVFSLFHKMTSWYHHYLARKYKVSFFSICEFFPNTAFIETFIRELRRQHIKIYLWTVNDFITMNHALSWKPDGIITNYPDILKRLIANR